jgi:hypothetical protein
MIIYLNIYLFLNFIFISGLYLSQVFISKVGRKGEIYIPSVYVICWV